MSHETEAWVLYPGHGVGDHGPAELVRETFEVPDPGPQDCLVRPLYGCWEGNMGHALERKPVDVCSLRKEPKVVLGNAGVVEVLETGAEVTTCKPGDRAIVFCNGEADEYGYPKRIFGYDARGTIGMLARLTCMNQHQLIPIETDRYDLVRWAGFSLRYVTAWSNWRLAMGVLRLQIAATELPDPYVLGWGGGVTLAELHLAHLSGCRTAQVSSSDDRRYAAEQLGIQGVDRNEFPDLNFDDTRYRSDAEYRERYKRSEERFLEIVRELTGGKGVNIFIDYVGSPVLRATLKAMARQGVLTTAGWKEGMTLTLLRAIECIERHQHVHTHYARYPEGVEAVRFAEANEWLPTPDPHVYDFDEIPKLAQDYLEGRFVYFPCYRVNPE